jgi:hypothetical protein
MLTASDRAAGREAIASSVTRWEGDLPCDTRALRSGTLGFAFRFACESAKISAGQQSNLNGL